MEDEIIQSRFILTGILFWLITLFAIWIFKKIYLFDLFFKKIKSDILGLCLSLFFWTIFYCLVIFPIMPLFLGGGQPKSLAIIVDIENMKIIKSFEIVQPENAPYQTDSLCIAYENSDNLIFLRKDRILSIDKSNIDGIVSLPGIKQINENTCIDLAYGWAWGGAYFSILLFTNQIFKWWWVLILIGIILVSIHKKDRIFQWIKSQVKIV